MFDGESQSYYEVLDVKPDASQAEIRQAYLRTKSAYSKDSAALYTLFDERETRQVLENIEQAYQILSNSEKRREYDRVHGFIRQNDGAPIATRPPGPTSNVFSFAKGGLAEKGSANDPAHQAARSLFGTGAEPGDMSGLGSDNQGQAAPAAAATASSPRREQATEDYSTPRTLASHNAAGPPVQEYSSGGFGAQENRLGVIRRVDLVKPYEKNPEFEQAITAETEFRGAFLRKVREYRGITTEELAEFTKISRTYISCIESEEFESLPAPAYLRGFIVQLSKALKLPHDKAAAGYMAYYRSAVSQKLP